MKKLILASESVRRRELLKKAGLKFRILPSRIKESLKPDLSFPEKHVVRLALAKAEAIAKKVNNGLVIGADTIVVFNNKIIGKPKNPRHAKYILSLLNNTRHFVYTAVAVIDARTKKRIVDIEKTCVHTRKLSVSQIKKLSEQNQDKAGAYAIQAKKDVFVKKIEGDYYNVVGLPLFTLKHILKTFGLEI